MSLKKICLINVGANTSHRSIRSPLFPDGKFEFIPIPDFVLNNSKGGLKYCQLKSHNGIEITDVINKKHQDLCAHYDPEFESYTYGDYPTFHPRAANLCRLSKGDFIFFFSRLVHWKNGRFTKEAKFCLIGFIEIKEIYRNICKRPPDGILQRIRNNAHVIRAECDPIFYDGFWVFLGSNRSKRFEYCVPLDRKFIEGCGLLDAYGVKWKWHKFGSELSAIGSYLRSAKLIHERRQLKSFWELLNKHMESCYLTEHEPDTD